MRTRDRRLANRKPLETTRLQSSLLSLSGWPRGDHDIPFDALRGSPELSATMRVSTTHQL